MMQFFLTLLTLVASKSAGIGARSSTYGYTRTSHGRAMIGGEWLESRSGTNCDQPFSNCVTYGAGNTAPDGREVERLMAYSDGTCAMRGCVEVSTQVDCDYWASVLEPNGLATKNGGGDTCSGTSSRCFIEDTDVQWCDTAPANGVCTETDKCLCKCIVREDSPSTWSPYDTNMFGYAYTTPDRVADGTYLAISQASAGDAEHLYTFTKGDCSSRYCKSVLSEQDCRGASEVIPGATYVQPTTTRSPFVPEGPISDMLAARGEFCEHDNGCSYDIESKTVTQCDRPSYSFKCTEQSPCMCLCVVTQYSGMELSFSNMIGYVYDSFQEVPAGIAFLAAFGFMSTMYVLVRFCLFCKKKEYLPIEQPQS